MTLPENYKIVQVAPTAAANAAAYDLINCKDAIKVWFVIQHQGTNDTDITISLQEAVQVAGTTTTAVTATFPIWVDTNAGTASDTLVKQTDAANYTINTGVTTDQLVVLEWDPVKHTDGYDCIRLADTGGNAGNYVTALAIIETRYPSATPPTAIVD
jgi:hypothetical protein